jgi:hypothetical protein
MLNANNNTLKWVSAAMDESEVERNSEIISTFKGCPIMSLSDTGHLCSVEGFRHYRRVVKAATHNYML